MHSPSTVIFSQLSRTSGECNLHSSVVGLLTSHISHIWSRSFVGTLLEKSPFVLVRKVSSTVLSARVNQLVSSILKLGGSRSCTQTRKLPNSLKKVTRASSNMSHCDFHRLMEFQRVGVEDRHPLQLREC